MFNNYSDLLTLEELCEILLIGRNQAYTLLNSGKIKALKIGRAWKIPKQSVIDYINSSSHHLSN